MAENPTDFRLSFKSVEGAYSNVSYKMNLPNIFTLPEHDGITLDSPSFKFKDATWIFRFCSVNESEDCKKRSFSFFIIRLSSEEPKQNIFYRASLLDRKNTFLGDFGHLFIFNKDNVEYQLANFRNYSFGSSEVENPEGRILKLKIHLIWDHTADVNRVRQVPLERNKDCEVLSDDFKKLLLSGENYDLTLKVADKEFRVHQDILMARSQVFEAMLSHDMVEKNEGVIDIPDSDPQAVEQFLHYVYTGKVETYNEDNVLGLYYLADKYNMLLLKDECSASVKRLLSPSIFADAIQLALNHTDTDLLECATNYFINHIREILPTVGWMTFMKINPVAANELLIKTMKKCNC